MLSAGTVVKVGLKRTQGVVTISTDHQTIVKCGNVTVVLKQIDGNWYVGKQRIDVFTPVPEDFDAKLQAILEQARRLTDLPATKRKSRNRG